MDEGLAAYAVRGKGSPSKVEELITYFVVTCNDEASVAEDKSGTYFEGLITAISFLLKVRGGVTS